MKKIIFASLVLAAISCKKSDIQHTNVNSSVTAVQGDNTIIVPGKTKFGSSIGGNFTNDECVSIAKNLNAKYVRDAITMSEWNGKSFSYEGYTSNGIKVVLNVLNQPLDNGAPFPTNMTNYRQKFNSITDKYQPELIVVENEEINPHYHTGPMKNYISMLQVALDVCHSKGIKVANGGIYGPQLEVSTYRYLQTKSQKRADSFANNCMLPSQVNAAKNPGSDKDMESKVRQLDTLLNFYDNLDYVNVHLYEPFDPDVVDQSKVNTATPVVVADIQEYLITKTGRPVITNETGQRNNTSPSLVTSMLKKYDDLNFPYTIWYSNDGDAGCQPLHNLKTGVLYNNGIAYSNYLGGYY